MPRLRLPAIFLIQRHLFGHGSWFDRVGPMIDEHGDSFVALMHAESGAAGTDAASRAAASTKHGSPQMPNYDGGQRLAPRLIDGVEAREVGTVEVEHAQKPVLVEQRHDEFGTRRRVAGDMPRKRVNAGH